jgi:hypothetical protein
MLEPRLPFDERPPRNIFVQGIDRQNLQLTLIFSHGRSIEGRPFRLPGFVSALPQADHG